MKDELYRVFIQVRMSSSRFPGKTLAPLGGQPIVDKVYDCFINAGVKNNQIVFLTSNDTSDKPIYEYLNSQGKQVFKGDLKNVTLRYKSALYEYPSKWIIRATGDSPFYHIELIKYIIKRLKVTDKKLISTNIIRSLPKGLNLEAFHGKLLIDSYNNTKYDIHNKEHVTRYWHKNLSKQDIEYVKLKDISLNSLSVAIDTIEDLINANNGIFSGIIDDIPWDTLTFFSQPNAKR